jgi:hypothetical protein
MHTLNCPKCEKDIQPVRKDSGPHLGLYCWQCGSWLKWGSKKEWGRLEPWVELEPPTVGEVRVMPTAQGIIEPPIKFDKRYIIEPPNQIKPKYLVEAPFDV